MTREKRLVFIRTWLWNRKYFLLLFLIFLFLAIKFINDNDIYPEVNNYLLVVYFFFGVVFFGFDLLTEYDKFQKLLVGRNFHSKTAVELLLQSQAELELIAHADEVVEIEPEGDNDAVYFDAHEVEAFFELWTYQMVKPLKIANKIVEEMPQKRVKKRLSQELIEIEQHAELVLHYITLASYEERAALAKINVYDLVRQTIDKYSLFFIQREIKLTLGELKYEFVTDAKWFTVILEQVIANVVKYSKKGQLHIAVDGPWLAISDSGVGIAQSDLSKVFEGAEQVTASVSSTSLGLYLAKEIAKKLNIDIHLVPNTDAGTQILIGLAPKDQ